MLIPGMGLANRWTFYIGADGKIAAVDREVHAKTAGTDLAAKLAALKIPPAK